MSNMPLVSVVIPCYNHEKYVQDCIQSVIDQTYQNIELIIIDDGSRDRSVSEIRNLIYKCKERFARFEFIHRENMGLSATLNEALNWCQGKYFSVIASDDLILPNKIGIQVDFLEKNLNSVAVCGGVYLLSESHNIKKRVLNNSKSFNFSDILHHNHEIPAPTVLSRLQQVREIGYPCHLAIEDWYMWLKLTEMGKEITYLNEIFAYYRQHPTNISKSSYFIHEERLKVLSQFVGIKKEQIKAARAYCYLVLANDLLASNKKMALKEYTNYLRQSHNSLIATFNKKSIKFLIKYLIW